VNAVGGLDESRCPYSRQLEAIGSRALPVQTTAHRAASVRSNPQPRGARRRPREGTDFHLGHVLSDDRHRQANRSRLGFGPRKSPELEFANPKAFGISFAADLLVRGRRAVAVSGLSRQANAFPVCRALPPKRTPIIE